MYSRYLEDKFGPIGTVSSAVIHNGQIAYINGSAISSDNKTREVISLLSDRGYTMVVGWPYGNDYNDPIDVSRQLAIYIGKKSKRVWEAVVHTGIVATGKMFHITAIRQSDWDAVRLKVRIDDANADRWIQAYSDANIARDIDLLIGDYAQWCEPWDTTPSVWLQAQRKLFAKDI
jgi:hypothetical protein